MSPTHQDPQQYALGCKADAAQDVDLCMMALGAAEGQLMDARREVAHALLAAVLYAGMTTTDLAAVTGWSRRTVRRRLREADPWAHDLR
jgi:DNA-binding transcriptional regulator LsrR (DeoR family)